MKYPRTWNLEVVYQSVEDSAFTSDLSRYESRIDGLNLEVKKLTPFTTHEDETRSATHADGWASFMEQYSDVQMLGRQLQVYVNCHASADAQNKAYAGLLGTLSALSAGLSEVTISLRIQLKQSDFTAFEKALKDNSTLQSIDFALRELYRSSEHMMDEAREALAARLAVDGISAWGRFYTRKSSDLTVAIMEKGRVVKKSVSQLRFDHPERSYRENTFFAADAAWQSIADDCADALNHISGTRLSLYKQQGYGHFLDKPLEDNRLQRSSLEAMWDAIDRRKDMLKPWFDIKAAQLGRDKLSWFDQSAPMPGGGSVSFDEALEGIIEQFGLFDPQMGEFAAEAAASGFIESEDRSGKRPGAFCTRFHRRREPRVFMTFKESYGSMRTLAHELGHAYHGHVLQDQPFAHQLYVMSTAETASTFAEEIINDYLITHAEDRSLKLAMLDNSIRMSMVMLMNIHARFIFESGLYSARSGGELQTAQLDELMLDAQKTAYRDLLDSYDPRLWASKLHFYISGLSFYNFPYTFGYLFSNALYAMAREEGRGFADKYRRVLIDTGCKRTEDVIQDNLGLNIAEGDFWNRSLDLIEKRISEFIELSK